MTSARIENFSYQTLAYMVGRSYVLGIGKTSSWAIEAAPPNVDPSITEVPELALLIPATVTAVYWDPNGPISVNGVHYSTASNLADITTNHATRLLATATLKHNNLSIASYRALGLYLVSPSGGGLESPAVIWEDYDWLINTPIQILSRDYPTARTLVYTTYQPPTTVTANLTENIKLVF